jgi:CubicO group peptidase (beta-lactamase class C family)
MRRFALVRAGLRAGTLAVSLAAGAATVHAQDRDTLGLRPAFRLIDRFVAQSMQQHGTPGLSLALVDRRGLITARTYGYADLERYRPVQKDTRFEIGSISKSFTAIALMQLADSGRFDPSAPVTRYLPWFTPPSRFAPITGHHLLTHTAGLPSDRDEIPSSKAQAYLARLRPVGSAPGTYWAYSNIGYQVLGVLLETLAGKHYPDIIQQRILTPLGMKGAAAQFTNADRTNLAIGYQTMWDDRPARKGDPLVIAPWLEYGSGDGAIVASATDLGRYLTMLLNGGAGPNGRIISEQSFKRIMTSTAQIGEGPGRYGYGFGVRQFDGRPSFDHSGGMVGYSSFLIGQTEQGIGAIAFVNGPGEAGEVARFALRALGAAMRGDTLPALPAIDDPFRIPNARRYAGTYTSPDGRSLRFEASDDSLFLVEGTSRTALERVDDDAFLGPAGEFPIYRIRFEGDSTGMREVAYGNDWYAASSYKGPKSFTPPAEWKSYVGHYRIMQPWEPNFRVVMRKARLYAVGPGGDEQELTQIGPREFRIGDRQSAERLVFGEIVDGQALQATWSGMPYYRFFTP